MNIVDVKNSLHDENILAVISCSQYLPTNEKLKNLADKYESDSTISAYACEEDGCIWGVIILKDAGDGIFEIKSIATDPDFRNQGIASKLVFFVSDNLKCTALKAETDDDAVEFYRKLCFQIESLGEKYPGTIRYLCTLKRF